MTQWQTSTRRVRLPSNWSSEIRPRILRRDKRQCQAVLDDGTLCLDYANEVDHIKPGDDHSDSNLRAICRWHHKFKSSQEGGQAAARARARIRKSFRRSESHPGLV